MYKCVVSSNSDEVAELLPCAFTTYTVQMQTVHIRTPMHKVNMAMSSLGNYQCAIITCFSHRKRIMVIHSVVVDVVTPAVVDT
jgi:hypothetical protein